MVVRMLMPFMYDCEGATARKVNIPQFKADYRKKTGVISCELIIDASTCVNVIYDSIKSNERHLGLFVDLKNCIKEFLRLLDDKHINCAIFFDGLPEREENWVKSQYEKGEQISSAVNQLRIRQSAVQTMRAYLETPEYLKFILRNKSKTIQAISQAYEEILDYVAENDEPCFAVLTENSDFILTKYLACLGPDLTTATKLSAIAYDGKALTNFFGIHESCLPLLGTLCGNDFLSDKDLRHFHVSLLDSIASRQKRLSKRLIIRKVGEWLQQYSRPIQRSKERLSKTVSRLIGEPHLEEKISESLNSYRLPDKHSPNRRKFIPAVWRHILQVAEHRHRIKGVHMTILGVLDRLKYYQSCGIEIFGDPDFLPSGVLLRSLRRRFYGILLKERPKIMGDPLVVEFVFVGSRSLDDQDSIKPKFPPDHPGLLNLWRGNVTRNEKLKLLCWAMSDKLEVENVLKILPSLRFACLSLFYLKNEVKSGLKDWQIEAFVIHLLKSKKLAQQLPYSPNLMEVHFSSIYIRTWFAILALDDACGNPVLGDEPNQTFFDGKIFNIVYHSLEDLKEVSDLLDEMTMFVDIMNFLAVDSNALV